MIYSDYSRDRPGWFFGLGGWQLVTLAAAVLPVVWTINTRQWTLALLLTASWLAVALLVVPRFRGRSTASWLVATAAHLLGSAAGWTRYRSPAASGAAAPDEQADLPGVLAGIRIHEGPPHGPAQRRIALIQNHPARTWTLTAALIHTGLGMTEQDERDRQAQGLTDLLDACSRTGLVDQIAFTVRTVPDDGAERRQWVCRHRQPQASALPQVVNDELSAALTAASVRTEEYVAITVSEARVAREARHTGGGLDGRARVLYSLMSEIEAGLRSGMSVTEVTWLTSPELAIAVRTGFAPGERAGLIDAEAEHADDPAVNVRVPWSQAGPSGADLAIRHYRHDAWHSVSATVRLPDRGAPLGALAPVIIPGEPGERRALTVYYPILGQARADRQTANAEWSSDLASGIRERAGIRSRARQRADTAKAHGLDTKLAQGNCLLLPHAVCCVTVPNTMPIADFGRRLDASVRRAGFAPLRLDLSQDSGFAAAVIPLGVNLSQGGAW